MSASDREFAFDHAHKCSRDQKQAWHTKIFPGHFAPVHLAPPSLNPGYAPVNDDWSKALDQGHEVCVVFFDVSKAFDTVPHSLLLTKLYELNLNPYLLQWIKSYLSNRSQYVCVDSISSSVVPVVSGVPQGSVLGPLLYIIYINDTAASISPNSDANMFADDIALYRIIKTSSDYVRLQEDINSVSTCIRHKQFQFNANKCKLVLITKKKANSLQPPQLTLNGAALNRVYSYKYLGITIYL